MRTVGLVPKLGNASAAALCRLLVEHLTSRGLEAFVEREAGVAELPTLPGTELSQRAELLVALGGDGTLLHAAGLCGGREVPILGVNLGTLGYLTEAPREQALELVDRALSGELPVYRRSMLAVEARRKGELLQRGVALNDAVVAKGALSRLTRLIVSVDGKLASAYEADGLIIATPTGSTAYSLSAGGPIIYPTVDAIVLTPICPHALTQRPLVLPASLAIEVALVGEEEMFLSLDGVRGAPLLPGDLVLVGKAPQQTLLVGNPELDVFAILRAKLRWGTR